MNLPCVHACSCTHTCTNMCLCTHEGHLSTLGTCVGLCMFACVHTQGCVGVCVRVYVWHACGTCEHVFVGLCMSVGARRTHGDLVAPGLYLARPLVAPREGPRSGTHVALTFSGRCHQRPSRDLV